MAWAYHTADGVPNDGPKLTALAIVFTTLSLFVLCLRFYVRGVMVKAMGQDDYVLVVTWIASCGFAIITILQTKQGLGLKDINDMPDQNVYSFGLLQFMGAPFYITSILGFKLSLLLSYLRFMPTGATRTATIVVIVACSLFHLAFLITQINLCTPVAFQWDLSIANGHCLPSVKFYTSMASLTIMFDVLVMLLPFHTLLQSKIQNRKKIVLLGLFGLGIFITVIQIFRMQTVSSLANSLDSAPLIMWSTIENNLGIIVASVPTLAPLSKYFIEKTRSGYKSSSTNNKYGGENGSNTHRIGSKYAMQTWRSTKQGHYPLSSGVDAEMTIQGGANHTKQDSLESILGLGSTDITKTTEVTVESEPRSMKETV